MNAGRNRPRKQNQIPNRQQERTEPEKRYQERKKSLSRKTGDYLLDLSKLVFAGVILTGVVDLDLNKAWLFSTGAFVASSLAAWGFFEYKRGID